MRQSAPSLSAAPGSRARNKASFQRITGTSFDAIGRTPQLRYFVFFNARWWMQATGFMMILKLHRLCALTRFPTRIGCAAHPVAALSKGSEKQQLLIERVAATLRDLGPEF